MTEYIPLDPESGWEYLSKIWNIQFKTLKEGGFFVEPWVNRERADCALFRPAKDDNGSPEIFFLVSKKVAPKMVQITGIPLFLYGACGQVTVLQIRSKGVVTQEDVHPERDEIVERVRKQIIARTKSNVRKLDRTTSTRLLRIIKHGNLFCFRPEDVAYSSYSRG